MRIGYLSLLLTLPVASPCLRAADEPTSDLLACATLRNDSERLACYDRLAARLSPHASPAPAPDAAPARDMFGLSGRAPEKEPKKTIKRSALDSITARVTSLREGPRGGVLLELDNGQAWQELESANLLLKVGDAVHVSRAALGSFWLSTPSGRGARVRRVR
jgi:hypothetical protein